MSSLRRSELHTLLEGSAGFRKGSLRRGWDCGRVCREISARWYITVDDAPESRDEAKTATKEGGSLGAREALARGFMAQIVCAIILLLKIHKRPSFTLKRPASAIVSSRPPLLLKSGLDARICKAMRLTLEACC